MKRTILFVLSLILIVSLVSCKKTGSVPSISTENSNTAAASDTPAASSDETVSVLPEDPASTDTGQADPDSQSAAAATPSSKTTPKNSTSPAVSASPPASSAPPRTSTPAPVTDPPVTSAPTPTKPSAPTAPVYTQKDYDDIINAVKDYAAGKTKVNFFWDPSIEMDPKYHGWHDTPNLTQHGKDYVISTLKYDIDLTEQLILGQVNGAYVTIPYNIVWYEKNGEIYFAQLY